MLTTLKSFRYLPLIFALSATWGCTSTRLAENKKGASKPSEKKDESPPPPSPQDGPTEVPPWTDMIDASQVGLAPADANAAPSQPSTQVAGANLTDSCATLDGMGPLSLPNKAACVASRFVRDALYANQVPTNGATKMTCLQYDPAARNGLLMDISCRDIYKDRLQMAQAKDLQAGSDSVYDIFQFDGFDVSHPAIGTWTASGGPLGRYPAQLRYWSGTESTKEPVFALVTDGDAYAKGYFDLKSSAANPRGEYDKTLVADTTGCRAAPSETTCIGQNAKVVLPGSSPLAMSYRTFSNLPKAPDVVVTEGSMGLSPAAAAASFSAVGLPHELTLTRQVYFRVVQAGGQIWSQLDLKDEAGLPIADSSGMADRWRSAAGVCQNLSKNAETVCTDIDPKLYLPVWQGATAYVVPPFDYQIPVAFGEAPKESVANAPSAQTGTPSGVVLCDNGQPTSLTLGAAFTCPDVGNCGGKVGLAFFGAKFQKDSLQMDWFNGSTSDCATTPAKYAIDAMVKTATGVVPSKGSWGEKLDAPALECETDYPGWTYRLSEAMVAFESAKCLYVVP